MASTNVPTLTLKDAAFPLVIAQWPASAETSFWQATQWAGSDAGIFLPFSPLYQDIHVGAAPALLCSAMPLPCEPPPLQAAAAQHWCG